ncbi:MAG: 16S rRNA processing protein RimM [Chloroflexi bacterium]|nr:16S rRNA processing protein RimM [Chloroflexota bacterium]
MQETEYIAVGRVLAPWGIRGQMKIEPMTDFPERFAPGQGLYSQGRAVTVEKSHRLGRYVVLKLVGVDTVEESESFRGRLLEVKASEVKPLAPGQYYHFQLVGLGVWTDEGEFLGEVREVMETGSNDVYVVDAPRGEILIPAIEDVVKEVDLERRRITVQVIEGLLP